MRTQRVKTTRLLTDRDVSQYILLVRPLSHRVSKELWFSITSASLSDSSHGMDLVECIMGDAMHYHIYHIKVSDSENVSCQLAFV